MPDLLFFGTPTMQDCDQANEQVVKREPLTRCFII
jgi:hypothetical protein